MSIYTELFFGKAAYTVHGASWFVEYTDLGSAVSPEFDHRRTIIYILVNGSKMAHLLTSTHLFPNGLTSTFRANG
jgi:hypothetical protein